MINQEFSRLLKTLFLNKESPFTVWEKSQVDVSLGLRLGVNWSEDTNSYLSPPYILNTLLQCTGYQLSFQAIVGQ